MPPAIRTRTQRSKRTKPSNQSDGLSVDEPKKTFSDKSSERSSRATSLLVEESVSKNGKINAGGDSCSQGKNNHQEDHVNNNELNILKDLDENDSEPLKKRCTRTQTSRSCKRGVTDGDEIEIKNVSSQRSKRSKKNNVENANFNNVDEETNCKSVNKNQQPSNSDLQNKLSDVGDDEKLSPRTDKNQLNKADSNNIAAADKSTASKIISRISASTDSNPKNQVDVLPKVVVDSVPSASASSTSACTDMKTDKLVSIGCSSNVTDKCEKKTKSRSRENNDNYIKAPCRCSKRIQSFGPYSNEAYTSRKILGTGVEIQKCLKHEKTLMAGFVKIHGESSMSGKTTNNTVYMVVEGNLRVDISGNVKNLKTNDYFMVVQDTEYEFRNSTQETVRLSFVKISRELS